jgi:hypothetical protein
MFQLFFNILKEPLLAQKQMIVQKKALILIFWEPARQRCGIIRSVPCLLAAKSKGAHRAKKFFFMTSVLPAQKNWVIFEVFLY